MMWDPRRALPRAHRLLFAPPPRPSPSAPRGSRSQPLCGRKVQAPAVAQVRGLGRGGASDSPLLPTTNSVLPQGESAGGPALLLPSVAHGFGRRRPRLPASRGQDSWRFFGDGPGASLQLMGAGEGPARGPQAVEPGGGRSRPPLCRWSAPSRVIPPPSGSSLHFWRRGLTRQHPRCTPWGPGAALGLRVAGEPPARRGRRPRTPRPRRPRACRRKTTCTGCRTAMHVPSVHLD